MLSRQICPLVVFSTLAVCASAFAAEPNNTFQESTIIAPGVTIVSDTLIAGYKYAPDTLLGTLDMFGNIQEVNDDDSIYGDGYASGLSGVPINPGGTIDFQVTGFGDDGFAGNHSEYGQYEVRIDIFDFFGDQIDTYFDYSTMQPGNVDSFHLNGDFNWLNGSYDVNIDNLWGDAEGGDVDFYTFTGLTPGKNFILDVRQLNPDGFDSVLGWFDETGIMIDSNDDGPSGTLSQLQGTVPDNGELTFAVTGWPDYNFAGAHQLDADYYLDLTIVGLFTNGDFDEDGDVDGQDFLIWQRGGSPNGLTPQDLAIWQENYGGFQETLGAVQAVPEPRSLGLLAVFALAGLCRGTTAKPQAI